MRTTRQKWRRNDDDEGDDDDALWRTRRQRTTPKNQSRFSFCFSELWPSLVFHCYKTPSLLLLLLLRLNNQFVWHKISLILEGKKEGVRRDRNEHKRATLTDWLTYWDEKRISSKITKLFSPSFAAGLLILILGCFMLRAFLFGQVLVALLRTEASTALY